MGDGGQVSQMNEETTSMDEQRRTFVVKAVYPIDTGTFVIASQDEEVFWIFDLVCKEEADSFQ